MNARTHQTTFNTVAIAGLLLTSAAAVRAEPDLQQQLQAAESQSDTPAIAEICRRLVEADAGNLAALRRLVRTSLTLDDIASTRRHLAELKQAVGVDDPGVLEIEGDLLARDDKDDEAVAAWQAALKADSDNAGLLAKLGSYFLNSRNDHENASYYFERLLVLRASANDNIIVAEAAAMRRDWTTVIERTATLKSEFAADSGAKRKVPGLERLIDSMVRITILDKRIRASAPPVPLILERGLLFRELGYPRIGLIDARRAFKMSSDSLSVRLAYAMIGAPLWSEHERIRSWDINPHAFRSRLPAPSFLEHLRRLEATLRKDPSNVRTLCERAQLLLKHGQQSLALHDIDSALAASPPDPEAHHLKASILSDTGSFREAVSHIERALASKPDDPAILRSGIKIFAAQGEFQRAIALCDTYPASADKKERKAVLKQRDSYYERLQQQPPAQPSR